jgi:hypothetical protein
VYALCQYGTEQCRILINAQGYAFSDNKSDDDYEKVKDLTDIAELALHEKSDVTQHPLYGIYHASRNGFESVFVLRNSQPLSEYKQKLLHLFSQNAVVNFENLVQPIKPH